MVRSCQRLGWPQPPADMMRQLMTHRRDPIEMLFGNTADAEERRNALHQTAQSLWQPLFSEMAHPFDDAIEVLRHFDQSGFQLGIVTDSNHEVVSRVTSQPGCPQIDVIITREESGTRKPDPKPMQLALEGLGLDADSVIYVGDNPGDIEAGAAVGMPVIGITTGPSTHDDLHGAGAAAVVDSLAELTDLLRLSPPVISGSLTQGLGVASGFTQAPHIQQWLTQLLGQPIYPGTVNLNCNDATAAVVRRHRHDPAMHKHLLAGAGHYCDAHFHRVTLSTADNTTAIDALLMWPEVADYPDNKLELVCSVAVRQQWRVDDGHPLKIRYQWHGTE